MEFHAAILRDHEQEGKGGKGDQGQPNKEGRWMNDKTDPGIPAGAEPRRGGINPLAILLFVVLLGAAFWWLAAGAPGPAIIFFLAAFVLSPAVRLANQWERAVVLRLGRFARLSGPGMFLVWPVVEGVYTYIDLRVRTTSFYTEQTLTRDTVPIDVDAVFYWVVADAKRAPLEVANYREAVFWAAQTAMRDIIGRSLLAELLSERERINVELQKTIDQRTEPWGISVQAVEVRDVKIPGGLQNAMSMEAQAERERRARIILGTAESEIAVRFVEAAKTYEGHPTALHLRAMNMLYEGLKEKGAMIVVPSTAVESMGLGALGGLVSLGKGGHPPAGGEAGGGENEARKAPSG
jgi:regulator of protease activity HflC (stomatin/prohibitin superfamily)